MSLKAKLASTIAAVCMVICLLSVGIWAAIGGSLSIGGSISFVAEDIAVKVTGATTAGLGSGAADPLTGKLFEIKATDADDQITAQPWTAINYNFIEDSKNAGQLVTIVITLTVENKGSVPVKAYLTETKAPGDDVTMTLSAASESAAVTVDAAGSAGASKTLTISFATEKTAADSIASADWGVTLTIKK